MFPLLGSILPKNMESPLVAPVHVDYDQMRARRESRRLNFQQITKGYVFVIKELYF